MNLSKLIHTLTLVAGVAVLVLAVPGSVYAQSEEEILESIDAQLKSEEEKKKEQEKIDKAYQALKVKADASFKAKKYAKARSYYEQMLKLKPDSDYARNQIRYMSELEAKAREAKIEADYKALITEADKHRDGQNWEGAKAKYKAAAELKPDEKYPKDQLRAVAKLEAEAKAAAEAAALQKKYDAAIALADKAVAGKSWEEARQHYSRAARIKPGESYPAEQLKKVDELEAKAKAEREQMLIDKKYATLIAGADEALAAKNWEEAKEKYRLASQTKPGESYPKQQLAKVDKMKADYEAQKKQEAIDKQYAAIITSADKLMKAKQYDEAILKYNEAAKVKPGENYPALKIAEIEKIKGDLAAARERAEKEKQYKEYLVEADRMFKAKDWKGAIDAYKLAVGVLPAEEYPKKQIAKAEANIKLEKDKAEQAAKLEADFDAAMKKGKAAVASADWDQAIVAFSTAASLKPSDNEARQLLAEAKVSKSKAEKAAEEKRLAEERAAKVEADYKRALSAADAALAAGNLTEARKSYEQAMNLKPGEAYPKNKIAEVDKRIAADEEAARKAAKEKARKEKENKARFEEALDRYDAAVAEKDYQKAAFSLAMAEKLFPDHKLYLEKAAELERMMADEKLRLEREKAAKEQAARVEGQYAQLIAAGDAAMAGNNFDEAKNAYRQAAKLKPEEKYPKDQLVVIGVKQEEMRKAAELAAEEERKRLRAIDDEYSKFMSAGEQAIQARNWDLAKENFRKAKEIKPDAMGPVERIAEIDRLMEREEEKKRKAKKAEEGYASAVAAAKDALDIDDLASAQSAYKLALEYKPDDEFAKLKLAEVSEQIRIKEEAEARKRAEEEAKRRAEEEKRRAEEEAKRRAEEEARRKAEAEAARLARIEADFSDALTSAETAMNDRNFKAAISAYRRAMEIKPERTDLQNKLDYAKEMFAKKEAARKAMQAERQRKLNEARKRREEEERKRREAIMREILMNSPEELAKRYPEGLTEEIKDEDFRIIVKSIIVEQGRGRYLLRFDYPWGAHFYFLNGKEITRDAYYWDMRKYL